MINWDAIVVGAGPAGGLSALGLAQRGLRVLLVEGKSFPREKVCGGCLNLRAWTILEQCNLTAQLEAAGAIPLDRLHLICGRRSVDWSMPTMRSLSRGALDATIAQAAVDCGAQFLTETQARILPANRGDDRILVELKPRSGPIESVSAKAVVAADGLAHSSLSHFDEASSRIAQGARIGLGAQLAYAGQGYAEGRLTMAVGREGYVGITRIESGRLNLAAAVLSQSLRADSRPADVVRSLLEQARLEIPPGLEQAAWTGTPPMTRESQRWSARRLFLVGDATGYVEPFTGEGMSWALAGALAVGDFVEQACESWTEGLDLQWHAFWRTRVRRHQGMCRALAWLLRRPGLSELALGLARFAPWMTRAIMRKVAGAQQTNLYSDRWLHKQPRTVSIES